MKIAFLFAGQGSQYQGMGKDFYDQYACAKQMYDHAEMDFDIKDICFAGSEEDLNNTAYTQSCILLTSMAIYEVLKSHNIEPAYMAGLSLGEYSALCAAKVIDLNDALQIVRKRGLIMANALEAGTTKMAAVLNSDANLIQKICEEVSSELPVVSIANYNSPNQIVITGSNAAVDEASARLSAAGVRRILPLKVSGAFHSPLLEEASNQLEAVLSEYEFHKMQTPIVFNVSGKEESQNLKDVLKKQIKSSVYFMQSIEYMIEQGVDTFIEIGPGHTLSSFVKKISKDVTVVSVDHVEDIEKVLEVVAHG